MIKILQVWGYYLPIFTGAAIRHNNLTPCLREQKVEIKVLTPQWHGTSAKEKINDTLIHRLALGPIDHKYAHWTWTSLGLCQRLLSWRDKYDIVHAVTTNSFYAPAFLLAKKLGKPVIIEFTLLRKGNSSADLLNKAAYSIFRQMDAFIGISSPLIQEMNQKGLPRSKCHLIPGGVDVDLFHPVENSKQKCLREKLNLQKSVFYLVFIGSFIYRKGIDILINIMEIFQDLDEAKNIELIIIGEHNFSDTHPAKEFSMEMKKKIKNKKLEKCIHFIGRVNYEKILFWLQASDLFVFPSRREGLGRVIIEAMSVGLPCLISELNGIAYDMIESNINGVIVDDYSPRTFVEEIIRLLRNPSLCKKLGSNARETVVNKFNKHDSLKRRIRLYKELMENYS